MCLKNRVGEHMNKNETCIGKIIYSKLHIEWMRYNMYIESDKYRNIPMLVFRVQESCPENLVDTLKECIDSFEGKICWKLFENPMTRKTNYVLSISELEDLYKQSCSEQIQYNQIDYFGAEKYKKFCDDAILEIPMLAKHIAEIL